MAKRVLLVEDHPLLAEALGLLLAREKDLAVIGAESTSAGALAAVERERPDVVVMDQHLPDGRGTDSARAIRLRDGLVTIVMLTADTSDETLLAAVEAGVAAFIPKRESAAKIVELVLRAADGEMVIPAEDLVRVMRRRSDDAARDAQRERAAKELTPRDREILDLMAGGANTKEMVERTGLAVSTVRGHIQAVIEKLAAHSRLEAVVRATELGLVRHVPRLRP